MEEARLVLGRIDRYRLGCLEEVYADDRSPHDDKKVVRRVDLVDNDRSVWVNEICLFHCGADLLQVVLVDFVVLP